MTDNIITTRPAVVDDIPDLCRIEAECFSEPWSERGFTEFFAQSYSAAYVALHGDTVVGYAGMYISFGEATSLISRSATAGGGSARQAGLSTRSRGTMASTGCCLRCACRICPR